MLNFADGAMAQPTSGWHDTKGRASGRHLELFFERGYFSVDQDCFGSIKYETNDTQGPATISDQEVRQRYFDITGLEKDVFDQALGKYSLEDYFFLQALAEDREPHPHAPGPPALRAAPRRPTERLAASHRTLAAGPTSALSRQRPQ